MSMRRRALLSCVAVALLVVGPVSLARADGEKIARIDVQGTQKVEDEVVRRTVTTRADELLDRHKLAGDVRAL